MITTDPSPRILTFFAGHIPEVCARAAGNAGLEKITWVSLGDAAAKSRAKKLSFPYGGISIEDSQQIENSTMWLTTVLVEIHNQVIRPRTRGRDLAEDPPIDPVDEYTVRQQNLWAGAALLSELQPITGSLPTGVTLQGIGRCSNRPASTVADRTIFTQEVRITLTSSFYNEAGA
jgi:hypothetical protein